jgi:hypothetical protein
MSLTSELISHEIAAANIILGSSRFLTIFLPPEWDLAPGVGRPEIVASHERTGVRWVASGQAWYVVYHREKGWAMELLIDVGDLRRRPKKPGSEWLVVDGHEAQVRWWERGRGLFKRRQITYLEIAHHCRRSGRFVRLELSGRCGEEGFRDLLRFIPKWRCH